MSLGKWNAPSGGGGIDVEAYEYSDRLYYQCYYSGRYELDPDTMLNISGTGVLESDAYSRSGVGGQKDRMYVGRTYLYEMDIDTLLRIADTQTTDYTSTNDVGGIADRLYNGATSGFITERDVDTLLDISSGGTLSPAETYLRGVGGICNALYCTKWSNRIYEIDVDTLLDISSGGVAISAAMGVGGTYDRLYATLYSAQKNIEIDPETMIDISSGGVGVPYESSINPKSIGGTKSSVYSIIEFNGNIDELGSDNVMKIIYDGAIYSKE